MNMFDTLILALGLGYLLGSIPFGLLLTRWFGAGDIRAIGSGNIGATNVLRTGRKGLAAATLLLDMAKGFLGAGFWPSFGVGFVNAFIASYAAAAGIGLQGGAPLPANILICMAGAMGALLGHCFPVWLRFRGGKGVATMLGISLAFDWRIGLACAAVWLAVARLSRISSLGGMASALAAPVVAWFVSGAVAVVTVPVLGLMALLVVAKHHANIARLIAGTEPRIGAKG